MNAQDKIILFPILGGVAGFIMWLILYEIQKTPAIEFDGPAELGIIVGIVGGAITFTLISFIAPYLRRKF